MRFPKHLNKLGLILSTCGAVGFVASFILTLDKLKLLQNPSYVPSCNISPIISCGSVMETHQASVFGFANSLIGVAAFAAVIMLGGVLLAGAKLHRWFWILVQTGALAGIIFTHWLIYQSLYKLGTLCPYCVAVWTITIAIFWYISVYNVKNGNLGSRLQTGRFSRFLVRHHGDIIVAWYLVIIILILTRFWSYWRTLL